MIEGFKLLHPVAMHPVSNLVKCLVGWSLVDGTRVPGLPIRDCARGCNNRAQMCAQLCATDVTARTFFERLYQF